MNLYEKILEKSKTVDRFWMSKIDDNFSDIEIHFGKYFLTVQEDLETALTDNLPARVKFIVDQKLNLNNILAGRDTLFLEASESKTKNIDFIEGLIDSNKDSFLNKTIVAVGGGVILDTALTISSLLDLKIILLPTTVLSMSDSCTGGKARANKIEIINGEEKFLKHFYRKFYNPESVIICKNFLDTIPDSSILFSFAEIIKHAFYQSEELLTYLLSREFDPFNNKNSILKAILWAQDLKRICIEVDPLETESGGKRIIRQGHAYADKIEKESYFKISHGEAVLLGIKNELENEKQKDRLEKYFYLFEKMSTK